MCSPTATSWRCCGASAPGRGAARQNERMGVRRVLVTGAEGTIGTAVREHLGDGTCSARLTLASQDFPSHVADIAELDAILPAFESSTPSSTSRPRRRSRRRGTTCSATTSSAPTTCSRPPAAPASARVVFASSNHTVGMYELDGAPDRLRAGRRAELRPHAPSSGPTRSTASPRRTARRSAASTPSATAFGSSVCGSGRSARTTTRRSPPAIRCSTSTPRAGGTGCAPSG